MITELIITKKFLYKKIYKKKFTTPVYKKNFAFSINMPNTQQNNEIEQINQEINLLQDLLKKNEKGTNQFQNGLMQIGRIQVKQGQRMNLSQTKKIFQKKYLKSIFQNKIKQIKENANLLQNTLAHVKKRDYLKKN